jgi:hypothetical protein
MDENRLGTAIEQTREGLTVRLGEGARLVRLGPSTVVVAEPDPEEDEAVAALAVKGETSISCVCTSNGDCKLILKRKGPSLVTIVCEGSPCRGTGCAKVTLDKLWDSGVMSRVLGDLFTGDITDEE